MGVTLLGPSCSSSSQFESSDETGSMSSLRQQQPAAGYGYGPAASSTDPYSTFDSFNNNNSATATDFFMPPNGSSMPPPAPKALT